VAPAKTELDVQPRRSTVYPLRAHLVFIIKYRRRDETPAIQNRSD
jgi:hypothetical protein